MSIFAGSIAIRTDKKGHFRPALRSKTLDRFDYSIKLDLDCERIWLLPGSDHSTTKRNRYLTPLSKHLEPYGVEADDVIPVERVGDSLVLRLDMINEAFVSSEASNA